MDDRTRLLNLAADLPPAQYAQILALVYVGDQISEVASLLDGFRMTGVPVEKVP